MTRIALVLTNGPRLRSISRLGSIQISQYLKIVAAVAAKDLRSEGRGRTILAVWGTFGLLLFIVFYITLNLSQNAFQTVAPGVLWIIFALIGTMGLGRGFNHEHELGGWQALMISPISHSAIYFGKLVSNLIVTLIAEITVLVGFSLIDHWPVDTLGTLIILVLGTLGLMGVGTFVAAYVADKGGERVVAAAYGSTRGHPGDCPGGATDLSDLEPTAFKRLVDRTGFFGRV